MSEIENHFDIVIVGGGAAGLFCGATLEGQNKRCLIIEHNKTIGKKILISGGGRCNFTNIYSSAENFHGENQHFAKSSLARFFPSDFIELVEKYKIEYFEKQLGQLFCKRSSREIVSLLESECLKNNVQVKTSLKVKEIKIENQNLEDQRFVLTTNKEIYSCKSLVIATGGLALPNIGASDFGYQWAKRWGHRITEISPGLVPLVINQKELGLSELSGISLDVRARAQRGPSFDEALLFTHKGLSGPAILQISSFWKPNENIYVNFLPKLEIKEFLEKERKRAGHKTIYALLKPYFPSRFLEKWINQFSEIDCERKLAESSFAQIKNIAQIFNHWSVQPTRSEGHRKAEVTIGGISTDELSSKTLESKKVKNLYFIGEVVDVSGWLGGYNFQWAWSSAYACSQSLNREN